MTLMASITCVYADCLNFFSFSDSLVGFFGLVQSMTRPISFVMTF